MSSNLSSFLKRLRERGIKLRLEQAQLRYTAPKGALDHSLLAELRARKAELVEFLAAARESNDSPLPAEIPRASRDAPLPLSFAQQRLWFLDQLEGPSATYNVPAALKLQGKLDVAALQRALRGAVARHDTLRSRFFARDGVPCQEIVASLEWEMALEDLRDLPASERDAEVSRLARFDAEYPFKLDCVPLFRATLLRLDEHEHVLLLCMHHIIADGWSIGVLAREVSVLYFAHHEGHAPGLPPLRVQYADYAQWQQSWLKGEVLERQMDYWRQQLANLPTLLELPVDKPRPQLQSFRGGSLPVRLNTELSTRLKQFAQTHDATLYIVLLAAFATLLMRYSNQDDIAIGSPIANRRHRDIEGLIGFFVNTLVLRVQFPDNLNFLELIEQVRRTALEAYAHQDVPFEHLVNALQAQRNMSHSPLFQAMFVFQNAPMGPLELPGLTLTLLEIETRTAKFDLLLSLEERGDGIRGYWEYNGDIFTRASMQRMLHYFENLLRALLDNPQQRVVLVPLLDEQDRRELLLTYNATQRSFDKLPVHERVARRAALTPDAPAVVWPLSEPCPERSRRVSEGGDGAQTQSLSYAELEIRANGLAHYLQKLGVGPDVPVGLCAERSVELAVAVLAVLKAGGAYVPLDPSYPRERLAFIVEDTKPAVLLTQTRLREQFAEVQTRIVCLDQSLPASAADAAHAPEVTGLNGDHLAYVIYTSGSTGRPKGVAMKHRALANLIAWQLEVPDFLPGARALQFSPISFDVSFQEIFSTWGSGGTLYLIADDTRRNAETLLAYLVEHRIQRLFQPFVALQHLAEQAVAEKRFPTDLHEVITAGEQLQVTPALVELFEALPECSLHNHYGPSETHVVTAYTLSGPPAEWPPFPPIGKPIANSQVYILDQHLQPVPRGVPGELYLAGSCLARGYLNCPDSTAERFVKLTLHKQQLVIMPEEQNPLLTETCFLIGAYRTGDAARWLEDGNVEFLGRLDTQVKIRGFRVELGEIEHALRQHPEVRDAAVTVHTGASGSKRLLAYIMSALRPERISLNETCIIKSKRGKSDAALEDISAYGVGIGDLPENQRLHVGDAIQIYFTLPGREQAQWLDGRTAWAGRRRAGIKFDLDSVQQQQVFDSMTYLRETRQHFKVLQRTLAGNLRTYLEDRFPDYMVPAAYILLEAMPLTPSGKLDRRRLPAPDNLLFEEHKHFTAPRDHLEMQLANVWEDLLGMHPVGIHDNFFTLGGHSLLAVRLVGLIKRKLGREVALSLLFQHGTIAELASVLREHGDTDRAPTLVGLQLNGTHPPMFWVHAVGGNVLSYTELARKLGEQQPFYAFQSPGLAAGQEMLPSVEHMAEHYLTALREIQPHGPYQLGGWSFGGLVAYEMAARLRTAGEEIHLLALLDTWTTIKQHLDDPDDQAEYVRLFARYLSGLFGKQAVLLLDGDAPMTLEIQLPHILKQAKLLELLPPELDMEGIERLLAVFRNNLRAAAAYTPPTYAGDVILFRAADKPRIKIPDLTLGWKRYVQGSIINHILPGDHYAMLRQPVVEMLGEALESYIL